MIKVIKKGAIRQIKNIVMVIYGMPGLGKTTAASTAKNPFFLDFDHGITRSGVDVSSTDVINNWSEISNLSADDLAEFDTIVIDTIGRCLEVLGDSLIKQDPRCARKDGSLTLQAYGALNVAFKSFITKLRSFNKDIILLAHSKEDKSGDKIFYRIDSVGNSKQEIYKIADMMGYIYAESGNRKLNFNPDDTYTAKNSGAIEELIIPNINDNSDFLATIIQKTKDNINSLSEEQRQTQKKYEDALNEIESAKEIKDINIFNNFLKDDFKKNHSALKSLFHKYATASGFIYSTFEKQYINPEDPEVIAKSQSEANKQLNTLIGLIDELGK